MQVISYPDSSITKINTSFLVFPATSLTFMKYVCEHVLFQCLVFGSLLLLIIAYTI